MVIRCMSQLYLVHCIVTPTHFQEFCWIFVKIFSIFFYLIFSISMSDEGLNVHLPVLNPPLKNLPHFLNHVSVKTSSIMWGSKMILNHARRVKNVQPSVPWSSPTLPRTLWLETCQLAFWGQVTFSQNTRLKIIFCGILRNVDESKFGPHL